MGDTNFRGPITAMGSLEGETGGTTAQLQPLDGPSILYQGIALADPRSYPFDKDAFSPGRIEALFSSQTFVAIDAIPSASSTTTVAAAQAPSTTAGVALTLTTAVLGTAANVSVWAPGIPIIPTNTTVPVTVSAIDFGFTTGTTAANSTTASVADNSLFTLGQWIIIPGAGSGSTTNTPLIAQVMAIHSTNGTGINISPAAATVVVNAPIGQGNLFNRDLPPATQFGPGVASANAALPYRLGGLAILFDPAQGVTRNLTITAASIGSGTTAVLASGYDIYGVPMTEIITADGTTTVNGKKAFKYVSSVVVQTAGTTVTPANINIGVGDLLGFPLRVDNWEYTDIRFGGGLQTVNTAWTSAITTLATNTSGDVRGTQNFSTGFFGAAAGSSAAGAPLNGVKRVVVKLQVPLMRQLGSNPNTYTGLFGPTQA